MNPVQAFAKDFVLYPAEKSPAWKHLSPLFPSRLRVNFTFEVKNATANQGQLTSNFDKELAHKLYTKGAEASDWTPRGRRKQKPDFVFGYKGKLAAVEAEKTNQEKILRDMLKCHRFLHEPHEPVDFAVIVLPTNYPHRTGMWNPFEFGVAQYVECLDYGFGIPKTFGNILLVGFTQCDAVSGHAVDTEWRDKLRKSAKSGRRGGV